VPVAGDQHPVQALALALVIHRSAIAFARGARTGVLMPRIPAKRLGSLLITGPNLALASPVRHRRRAPLTGG